MIDENNWTDNIFLFLLSTKNNSTTGRKRGFHTPPLVPKRTEPRPKGSLVAVREKTRDPLSGPSALDRQLADGRGFSPGWPGQPGLKVLRLARRPLVTVGQANRD